MSKSEVASLFAGIGGIERGLASQGFEPTYLCEWWEPAQAVLRDRFPGVPLDGDIGLVTRLPPADIVTAGFPCTDLSQAGRTAGITGEQSGLVRKALDLIEDHQATWLLLENVRNMLPLHGGRAMAAIVSELDRMGFRWAYRLVDSRFTGVPQRRQRVLLLASRTQDPRPVLFADDAGPVPEGAFGQDVAGFYWTEGLRGVGWCWNGVPTLKGGSTIGIPSPPAIWRPGAPAGSRLVVPGIATAEQMQGFPRDWTDVGATGRRNLGARWKMAGNAVTVGVSEWIARGICQPRDWDETLTSPLPSGSKWPSAAWGEAGRAWAVDVSMWPEHKPYCGLAELMEEDFTPLSLRATTGFLSRLERGRLRVPDQFRVDLKDHVEHLTAAAA